MARYSNWDPRKNLDFEFFDNSIQDMFEMGATSVFVHKYVGTKEGIEVDEWVKNDPFNPGNVQDILFLENRDRIYDPNVYELLGVHNVQDLEFSMSQFALYLEADTIFLTFHINDSLRRLGRKLMPGDVLELPHLRDDAVFDDRPAINKYYTIEEVTRPAEGFSPTWFPHLYRAKCKPMSNSQEYDDILNQPGLDANGDPLDDGSLIRDILGNYDKEVNLSNDILKAAEEKVDRRNFDSMQRFYVVPVNEDGEHDIYGKQFGWIFASSDEPPNGGELAGDGAVFPEEAEEGDWFLRTDMKPEVLFRREKYSWRRTAVNYRQSWSAAHRVLSTFTNNDATTTFDDGTTMAEKQPLSKAVTRPKKPDA